MVGWLRSAIMLRLFAASLASLAASCESGRSNASRAAAGPCGYPTVRTSVPVCGPSSLPCRVVGDEAITTAAAGASLAVDANGQPVILFRKDEFTFSGAFATKLASGWTEETTPFPVGFSAIVFDPSGLLHVLLNDGADTSVTYTTRDAGSWQPLSEIVKEGLFEGSLWAPTPGCLLGGLTERSKVELLQKSPTFSFTSLAADGLEVRSAISSNGRPELTWLESGPGLSGLIWQAPPDPAESIAAPPSEQQSAALLAVVGDAGGVGEPHLLYKQGRPPFESDPGTSKLIHAARATDGTWSTATVVQDQLSPRCFYPTKPPPGTTCSSRDVVHTPVSVIASDNGDVRFLYLTSERETVYQVDANGQGSSTTTTLSTKLDMAWPDGTTFGTTTLLDAEEPSVAGCGVCPPAQVLLDGAGTIHVVLVGSTLRYVAIAR